MESNKWFIYASAKCTPQVKQGTMFLKFHTLCRSGYEAEVRKYVFTQPRKRKGALRSIFFAVVK